MVERKATWADVSVLLRTPSYVLCSLGMTAMTFAMGGIAYWLPYYLVTVHSMKEGDANFKFGIIVVLSGLSATILGGITGDRLRERFSGSYFLVSGIAMLIGFPLIALVLVTNGVWLWVCIFMACFALFFNTGPTNTILANVTHPQIRASAFAINIFLFTHKDVRCRPPSSAASPTVGACKPASRPSGFPSRRPTLALAHAIWRDTARVVGRGS